MANYDAEIRVKTKVDNSEVIQLEASMGEAEKKAEDLGEAIGKAGKDKSVSENANQAADSMDEVAKSTEKAAHATQGLVNSAREASKAEKELSADVKGAAASAKAAEDAFRNTKIHMLDGRTLDWNGNAIEEAINDAQAFTDRQSAAAAKTRELASSMRALAEETRQANEAVYGSDVAQRWYELTEDANRYLALMEELDGQGMGQRDAAYDAAHKGWQKAQEALNAYRKELQNAPKETPETDPGSMVEQNAKPMHRMLAAIKQKIRDIPVTFGSAVGSMGRGWDNLSIKADAYRRTLKDLEADDKGFGDPEYDKAYVQWQRAEQAVKKYKSRLVGVEKQHTGLRESLGQIGKSALNAFKKAGAVAGKFFALFRRGNKSVNSMLKTMSSRMKGLALSLLVFNWISKGFNTMVEGMRRGFTNLMNSCDDYADSVQSLRNAQATLGNSFAAAFAPIVQTVIPYLVQLINWINSAINAMAQLLAYLSGKSTWLRATEVQSGYQDSLNGTADAAKKAAGALAKFDDLDVLQKKEDPKGSGGGGSTGGFEEVPIDNDIKKFADRLKDIMSKLFEPFKEAWNREGKFVMDSWKYALDEVWKLAKDIGRDFLTMWNQEATVAMFADILHILGDIGLTVGNIARGLDEAWNFNNTGLYILQNIRDIFAEIVRNIREAADYTVDWSKNLDFKPLLLSFKDFTKELIPVADAVSGVLMDFYTDVLLPLGKWTLEKGLPDLLDVFTKFNKKVDWKKLRKNIRDFWKALEPFAETVAQGCIIFLDRLAGALAKLLNVNLDGILDLLEGLMGIATAEGVADVLTIITGAILSFKGALFGLKALQGVSGIFAAITSGVSALGKALANSNILFGIQSLVTGAGTLGECLEVAFPKLSSFVGLLAAHPAITLIGGVGALTGAVWLLDDALYSNYDKTGIWCKEMSNAASASQELSDKINTQARDIENFVNGAGAGEVEQARILAERYNELAGKVDLTNAEKFEMQQLAQDLVQLIPELKDKISEETGMLDVQGTSLDALISKTETYYKLQAAQDKIVEAYKLQMEAQENVKEATERAKEAEEEYTKALALKEEMYNNSNAAMDYAGGVMDNAQLNVAKLKDAWNEQNSALAEAVGSYENATDTLEFLRDYMNETSEAISNTSYADFALNTSNTIDEVGGLWEKGASGWVQVVGEKAIEIQGEIEKGLTPDENGIFTAADGTMVAYGQALEAGITEHVAPTLDEALKSQLEASLDGGYEITQDAGGNWVLGLKEGVENNISIMEEAYQQLGKDAKDKTLKALDEHSPSTFTENAGKDWVQGLNNGIEAAASTTEDYIRAWVDTIKEAMNLDQDGDMFEGLLVAFQEKWTELTTWWSEVALPEFDLLVGEGHFSLDKWLVTFNNIYLALKQKWTEALTWWSDEATPIWWEESVLLWFSQEKWLEVLENVRLAHELKWKDILELVIKMMIALIGDMQKHQRIVEMNWLETMERMRKEAKITFQEIRKTAEAEIQAIIDKVSELSGALSVLSGKFSGTGFMGRPFAGSSFRSMPHAVSPASIERLKVPYLASGAVIRGGNPFLAVLGDQRAGQTNVEAPLSTIEQAVANVMNRGNYSGGINPTISLNVNGEEFARLTLGDILREMDRQGYDVEVLGVT